MGTTRLPYSKRNIRRKLGDEREQLWQENHLRGLRSALWLALLAAQDLRICELQGQITSMLVYIDELQEEHLDDWQDELADIARTFGQETAASAARLRRQIDLEARG